MERQIESIGDELSQFVKRFEVNESISEENAQLALKEFQEKQESWVRVLSYGVDCQDKNGNNITGLTYVRALVIYTKVLRLSKKILTDDILKKCECFIKELENSDSVKYYFNERACIRFNIGFCWNFLKHENEADENLRRAVYYKLRPLWDEEFGNLECFQFKSCSKYLLQSFKNNTLTVASPKVFNDIFDTPIIYSNDLEKKVYEQCVKVACFIRHETLPIIDTKEMECKCKPKGNKLGKEYENLLMWSHYGNFHKGVCIKYYFPLEMNRNTDSTLSFFKDVEYSDKIDSICQRKILSNKEAFFVKAKVWEYERELRFVHFDENDTGTEYRTLSMPENYIEAIYFGVNCAESDKNAIINILKGRTIKKDGQSTPIEFYQMKKSNEKYGEIYAEKI